MPKLFHNSYFSIKLWATSLLISIVFLQCVGGKSSNNQPINATRFSNFSTSAFSAIKDKSSIKTTIESIGTSNMYSKKSKKVGYIVSLINNLKEAQAGNIIMNIANAQGQVLYNNIQPFTLKKNGFYNKTYELEPSQLNPGMYVSNIKVETDKYSDDFNYSFGYEVDKQISNLSTPNDFINFWQQAQNELNGVAPNYKVVPRLDIKNGNCDVYEVQFNSTNNAVIYSWLTVPKGKRNNAVLYYISDYMSELKPEFRQDVAVFTLHPRGAGGSTSNFNYDYNALGLLNINDKNKYVLKGMFLDALRGFDFIKTGTKGLKVDGTEVIVCGNGLGASLGTLITVLNPSVKALIMDSPSFIDFRNTINFNEGLNNKTFPSSMFYSYYNSKKNLKESMLNTLDYFDAVNFAPYIGCATLVGLGLQNNNTPSSSVYNFYNQLRNKNKEKYTCNKCGSKLDKGFYGLKETWIKNAFKLP